MDNTEVAKNISNTADGNIIKAEWLRHYNDLPNYSDEIPKLKILSLCMPFNNALGGFVTAQIWMRILDEYYLINQIQEHMNFVEMLARITYLVKDEHPIKGKTPIEAIILDKKKNDPILLDILTHKLSGVQVGNYPVAAILVGKGKDNPTVPDALLHKPSEMQPADPSVSSIARCHAMSFLFSDMKVYIPYPDNNPWVVAYENALLQFPLGISNDEVNVTTQALYYLFKYHLGKPKSA